MESKIVSVLGFLLLAVSAGECHTTKAKLNFLLDMQLKQQASLIANSHHLPNETIGDIVMSGLSLDGLKSLARSGDAYAWVTEDNGLENHFGVRLGEMVLSVERMEEDGQVGSATFAIAENELRFGFKVTFTDSSCSMEIKELEITKLDKVWMTSDNPAFDGKDVSDVFTRQVVPMVNARLASPEIRNKVKKLLGGICA